MTITVDDSTVHCGAIRHLCATKRTAQITAATLALRDAGWTVVGPASGLGYRRPLALPGERMCQPLDGSLADQRAQGFTVWRHDGSINPDTGVGPRTAARAITIDACAGLPLLVTEERGDVAEAREIIEWYIGSIVQANP